MPSSVQLYSQAISDFKRIQTGLFESQAKIGADSKANTFAELGGDITVVESFKSSVARADRFIANINESSRKLDEAYRAVDRIVELAIDFKQDLALEQSANSLVNDINAIGNNTLDSIQGQLNAKDGASYLFSGSKTNEIPVNSLRNSSNYVDDIATANYYNGDEFISSVSVSTSLSIDYSVTASDSAFKDIISAINRAKEAELSGSGMEEASLAVDSALEGLISLRAQMGNNAKLLEDSLEFQTRAKTSFEQKLSDKVTPDVVELSIQVSQANAVLQASFQSFSRISSLSIIDFI